MNQDRRKQAREGASPDQSAWDEVTARFNEAFHQGQLVVDLDDQRVYLDSSAQHFLSRSEILSFGDLSLICEQAGWICSSDDQQGTTQEIEFLHGAGGRIKVYAWRIHDAESATNFIRFQSVSTLTAMPRTGSGLGDRVFRQQQLFSIISHELRTPAATLRMLIEELEPIEQSDVQRLFPQLRETSEHLLSVLQDMRQAVNPAQNLPMRKVLFHPNRLLENVAAQMRSLAEEKGINLNVNLLSAEALMVNSDIERLKLILLNLVKNALLHSRCSEVELTVDLVSVGARNQMHCSVRDNGRGIPESEIDRLFEPFERHNPTVDGSGLGLFIVNQTIEELGGTIEYKPVAEGGAEFVFHIPCELNRDTQRESISAAPSQVVPSTHQLLKSLRIIVVEDDPVIRMVSQRLLSKLVADVDVAENGRLGLSKILKGGYDLILTDFFMPEMDGREMIAEVRARGIKTPVIAVTAAVLGKESDQLKEAGANQVVAKPISMKSFIEAVEEVMQPSAR